MPVKNYNYYVSYPDTPTDTIFSSIATLSVSDQEYFMHLIYDIVHIGVSVTSMKLYLDNLYIEYGGYVLKNLLNNVMKDEKYSNERIRPMKKCIYQHKNYQSDEEFFTNKLEMIKMLIAYGAKMIDLDYKDFDILIRMGLINLEIKNYILNII